MPSLSQFLHLPEASNNSSTHDLHSESGRSIASNSSTSYTNNNIHASAASNASTNNLNIPHDSSQVWKSLNGSPGVSMNKEVEKIGVQLNKFDSKIKKELDHFKSLSSDKLKKEVFVNYQEQDSESLDDTPDCLTRIKVMNGVADKFLNP